MTWLPLCVSLFSHMVFRLTAEFWPLTYALLFEYNANLTWMCWKVKDTWVVVTYPGIFLVNSQFVMPLSWILTCTSQFHPSSTTIPARQIPTTNKKQVHSLACLKRSLRSNQKQRKPLCKGVNEEMHFCTLAFSLSLFQLTVLPSQIFTLRQGHKIWMGPDSMLACWSLCCWCRSSVGWTHVRRPSAVDWHRAN